MKKAWVTGSHGFVGPWLIRELQARGVEVLGIDRPGQAPLDDPVFTVLDLDLRDQEAVEQALEHTRPDAIFHLAAQSSAGLSFEQPWETLQVNLQTTVMLLEGMRRMKKPQPKLVAVGSSEEYGPVKPQEPPVKEEHLLRPASPYAVSKAAQTLLCQQYHKAYGLPIVCTRSFMHTGPGQSERFVFSSFARQIAELETLADGGVLRVGNLAAVRDVSDVRDVVRAYADLSEKGDPSEIYNVCSGQGLSIEEGLDILRSFSTAEIVVEVDPARLRPLDVPVLIGDASKLRNRLGWSPSTPLEETLYHLLEYWREAIRDEDRDKR